jgi:hypothetical protein
MQQICHCKRREAIPLGSLFTGEDAAGGGSSLRGRADPDHVVDSGSHRFREWKNHAQNDNVLRVMHR